MYCVWRLTQYMQACIEIKHGPTFKQVDRGVSVRSGHLICSDGCIKHWDLQPEKTDLAFQKVMIIYIDAVDDGYDEKILYL